MGHLVKDGRSRCVLSGHLLPWLGGGLPSHCCLGQAVCEHARNTLDLMKRNHKRYEGYFHFIYFLMSSQSSGVARSANGVFE